MERRSCDSPLQQTNDDDRMFCHGPKERCFKHLYRRGEVMIPAPLIYQGGSRRNSVIEVLPK
jgi:hypothetical protein